MQLKKILVTSTLIALSVTTGVCGQPLASEAAYKTAVDSFTVWLETGLQKSMVRDSVALQTHYLGEIPTILKNSRVLVYDNLTLGKSWKCVVVMDTAGVYHVHSVDSHASPCGLNKVVNTILSLEGPRTYSDYEILELVYLIFEFSDPFASRQHIISAWAGMAADAATPVPPGVVATPDSLKARYLGALRGVLGEIADSNLYKVELPHVERQGEQVQVTLYYQQAGQNPVRRFRTTFANGAFWSCEGSTITPLSSR